MSKRNAAARPSRLTLAAALPVIGVLALPSSADAAGTYSLIQCHAWNRASSEAESLTASGYSVVSSACGQQSPNWGYQVTNAGDVSQGRHAGLEFSAPYGTHITGFSLDVDARSADGHLAQVRALQGTADTLIHQAPNLPGGFNPVAAYGLRAQKVRVILICSRKSGCPRSSAAHTFVRNVQINLVDELGPALGSAGNLLGGGWKRGRDHRVSATSFDHGAGLFSLDVYVNGVRAAASRDVNCAGQVPPYTIFRVPCGAGSLDSALDTTRGPFRNGANEVEVVARDFAGNSATARYSTKVDNAPPRIAFPNGQDPEDPELIAAAVSDAHSGLAGAKLYMRAVGASDWMPLETRVTRGTAQARVDSAAMPAGAYEFKVVARDVAGNTAEGTRRRDGEPMRLQFPLRAAVELRAHLGGGAGRSQTVPYGTPAKVRGRLVDAAGRPIPGREVLVVENFGAGALIRHRPTTVATDAEGRFETKIPAGPSRRITAQFAGTRKYASDEAKVGALTVRSRATFRVERKRVPEGGRATFKGRVRHVGARIPSGGKLLELQVRLGRGRWDTVGEAFRTDAKGRFTRHYRFGNHYTDDAVFRFRVKVQQEGGWPYKRATSKPRKLVVSAK